MHYQEDQRRADEAGALYSAQPIAEYLNAVCPAGRVHTAQEVVNLQAAGRGGVDVTTIPGCQGVTISYGQWRAQIEDAQNRAYGIGNHRYDADLRARDVEDTKYYDCYLDTLINNQRPDRCFKYLR
jgi:hypothetical protein